MDTYWLDGPDVSQTDDLLHLKVIVFIHTHEVDLLSISTKTKRYKISNARKQWDSA